MSAPEGEAVVESFNERINARDLDGLAHLMSDDHVFIDSADHAVHGKTACAEAWRGFFAAFPDYRNVFEQIVATGSGVAVAGRSSCSDPRLDGPALWRAKLHGAQVSEWRVFEDTPANRTRLGLTP